jgi:hypothetical protein
VINDRSGVTDTIFESLLERCNTAADIANVCMYFTGDLNKHEEVIDRCLADVLSLEGTRFTKHNLKVLFKLLWEQIDDGVLTLEQAEAVLRELEIPERFISGQQ